MTSYSEFYYFYFIYYFYMFFGCKEVTTYFWLCSFSLFSDFNLIVGFVSCTKFFLFFICGFWFWFLTNFTAVLGQKHQTGKFTFAFVSVLRSKDPKNGFGQLRLLLVQLFLCFACSSLSVLRTQLNIFWQLIACFWQILQLFRLHL